MKKTKRFLLVLIYFVFICGILLTSTPTEAGISETVRKLQENGLITKIDIEFNEVFVDPSIWNLLPFDGKEKFGQIMATYFKEVGQHETWAVIRDHYSGKKLAKWNIFGFKVY